MSGLAANCITECTTPQHGYVAEGRDVLFDLPEWDKKKFPYLKHFKQKARAVKPQLSIDEGATAKKARDAVKAASNLPLGVSSPAPSDAPVAEVEVKKLSAMSPEELDDVKVSELVVRGQKHGVKVDTDADRTDIILDVMAAEDEANKEELFD